MAALLLLIIFGLATAALATQNTGIVHILIGNYVLNNIPLYVVIIGSLLLGVFISWLINLVDSLFTFLTIRGKDMVLRKYQEKIDTLQKRNHELEVDLASLRGDASPSETRESNTTEGEIPPSLFHRLKEKFHIPQQHRVIVK